MGCIRSKMALGIPLAGSLVLLTIGCARDQVQKGAPTLHTISAVTLQESDSVFIAEPGLGFYVSISGDLFLTDNSEKRLLKFDREGKLLRIIAGPGRGPAEFASFEPFTWADDSIVVQGTNTVIKGFNHLSGEFLGQLKLERSWLARPAQVGDTIYIPMTDLTHETGVARTRWSELLRMVSGHGKDALSPEMIAFPPEYLASRSLRDWTNGGIVAWQDSLLFGYSGVPYIVLYTSAGVPLDTMEVPAIGRRGFPDGWLEPYLDKRPVTTEEEANSFSYLHGVWRTAAGDFVLWYQENRVNPDGDNPPLLGRAWISILRKDRQTACVDASYEAPGTDWPVLGFFNNQLMAIDQVINADSTRASTVATGFEIDSTDCVWRPVQHSNEK